MNLLENLSTEFGNLTSDVCTSDLVYDKSYDIDHKVSLPLQKNSDLLFETSANASVSVKLLNRPSLLRDKLFSNYNESLSLMDSNALIGYSLSGTIKSTIPNKKVGKFEFGLDTEKSFSVKHFSIHPCGTALGKALADDFTDFKQIFSPDDVAQLKIGEALSLRSSGKLAVNASVNLAHAIAGSASIVSQFLGLKGKINFNIGAEASLSLSVSIADDFEISFIKKGADTTLAIVNKISKSDKSLKAKAGIEASLDNDDELEKLVEQLFSSIDRKVFDPINNYLKNNQTLHGFENSELLARAAELLNFSLPSLKDFEKAYLKKRQEAKEKLLEILTTKVSIGVAYEYSALNTSESIFKAEFTNAQLKDGHRELIRLRLSALVKKYTEAIEKNEPVPFKILEYLRRDTTEINSSFGISLAFGKFKLSSKVVKNFSKEVEHIVDESGSRFKVNMYNQKTTREIINNRTRHEYFVNFDLSMPGYVSNEDDVTLDKFDFEFGLGCTLDEHKTSKKELLDVVDWALTWDIIGQHQVAEVVQKIKNEVLEIDAEGIKYEFFLKVPEGQFEKFIPYFQRLKQTIIPQSLAASLPQVSYHGFKDLAVRNSIQERRDYYTHFFQSFLEHPDGSNLYELLVETLKGQAAPDLLDFEDPTTNYEAYNSSKLLYIVDKSGLAVDIVRRFLPSLDQLDHAIRNKSHYSGDEIRQSIKMIGNKDFLDTYKMRFVGRLLLEMNRAMPSPADIEAGFNISYHLDGEEKIFTVA